MNVTIDQEVLSKIAHNAPWGDKNFYANFLAQTYYLVRHSTKLLALSASYFKESDIDFQNRFFEHIKEEDKHDLIALKDIEKLGFKIQDFPELPVTKLFWESQYYHIQHTDPICLMGYILFLEVLASQFGPEIFQEIKEAHGTGFQFIKVHAEEDVDHVEKALFVINSLPEERKERIQEVVNQTQWAYLNMIESVKNESRPLSMAS